MVVDDTNSPRFTGNDWPWVMNRSLGPPDQQKCNVDPYQRIDCGYIGINQFDCEGKVVTCIITHNYRDRRQKNCATPSRLLISDIF